MRSCSVREEAAQASHVVRSPRMDLDYFSPSCSFIPYPTASSSSAISCLEIAAEPDSRDPPRSPAMTRPMASVFARRDGDKGISKRSWDWAFDCCHAALEMYHKDGDIKKARDLFRRALSCGANPRIVFHAWISMEAGHGDTAAVRACFEEWRSRPGGCRGDTDFWRLYTAFELQHGPSWRARAVAEAAMSACPRNPVVFAMYGRVELSLGCFSRARAIVRNARDTFTADVYPVDEEAAQWVEDELVRYHNYLREAAAWPTTIGDLFRSLLFCGRGGCGSA